MDSSEVFDGDVPAVRSALLSFTNQPPAWSPEAFEETYDFVAQHADMIAHFMDDGVPWGEALAGRPFSDTLEKLIADRAAARRPGQKVLLAINPVSTNRNDLALYFGDTSGLPLPAEWAGKTWEHPEVAVAYLAYVRRLAEALEPDYLSYAFEINSNWIGRPESEWRAFLSFLEQVHDGLRESFPHTPLVLEVVVGDDEYMEPRWRHTEPLFEFADVISISTYPYIFDSVAGNEARVPADWFERLALRVGDRPLAVQETGFLGGDFTHPELGVSIPGRGRVLVPGTPETQAEYVRFLLAEAQRLDFEFVNWWVWQDLDRLWDLIQGQGIFADPMAAQWNRTGMRDAEGEPRPALGIWDAWLAVPVE
ncbi:MAG: hypothetical protein K0U98_05200 [Deltaproteobacteria bacterium]|nr:hypothetical protein [Deltaproteobacteria bacterium]